MSHPACVKRRQSKHALVITYCSKPLCMYIAHICRSQNGGGGGWYKLVGMKCEQPLKASAYHFWANFKQSVVAINPLPMSTFDWHRFANTHLLQSARCQFKIGLTPCLDSAHSTLHKMEYKGFREILRNMQSMWR